MGPRRCNFGAAALPVGASRNGRQAQLALAIEGSHTVHAFHPLLLHRFFSHLESRPEFTFPSRLLADAIGAEAEGALCEASVLVPQGPATWYPCARGLRGCRRMVAADGARLHLLCGRSSGGCAAE